MAKTGEKEAKKIGTEEITLEKALKVIRDGLGAKLFIPSHFWVPVLEAYNNEAAAVIHLGGATAGLLKRAEAAEAEIVTLKDRLSEALNQLAETKTSILHLCATELPGSVLDDPSLEPAAQDQSSIGQ